MVRRNVAARIICISGMIRLKDLLGPKDELVILAYHRICRADGFMWDDGLVSASPEEFERQIRYIAERFTPISFRELQRILKGESLLPPKPIIVTFDDGYMDNYRNAFPILRRYGVPATFFIATGFVEGQKPPWWDLRAFIAKNGYPPVKGPEFMGWDEIERMAGVGMEFGSHTVNHISLTAASRGEAMEELSRSKAEIERRIGEEVVAFAYPYGRWNDQTAELVEEAGFSFAVTLQHGLNRIRDRVNPLALNRIAVERFDTFDSFRAKIGFPGIIRY
jgi:peptidoglycan/xylan/chitin deacetylase (PgdA/CDA1 family)